MKKCVLGLAAGLALLLCACAGAPQAQTETEELFAQEKIGNVSLTDGTPVDVWQDGWGSVFYKTADNTELLQVSALVGPDNVWVGDLNGMEQLASDEARQAVRERYADWGLRYDELDELEKAYAAWQEQGRDYQTRLIAQSVSPTAVSEKAVYFRTIVTLPREDGGGWESNRGDAFDRETGAWLDPAALFTQPMETVVTTLLDAAGLDAETRSAAEAAWDPAGLVWQPQALELYFAADEETVQIVAWDYADIAELIQPWALPQTE